MPSQRAPTTWPRDGSGATISERRLAQLAAGDIAPKLGRSAANARRHRHQRRNVARRRLGSDRRDPAERPVLAQQVDRAPVGEERDDEVGQLSEGGLVLERRAQHRRRLDEEAEPLLVALAFELGLAPGGDVASDPQHAHRRAVEASRCTSPTASNQCTEPSGHTTRSSVS